MNGNHKRQKQIKYSSSEKGLAAGSGESRGSGASHKISHTSAGRASSL